MTQIYVSIGNSDNKLSQREWAQFCEDLLDILDGYTGVATDTYGQWYSLPNKPYQNMVASIEVGTAELLTPAERPTAPASDSRSSFLDGYR